MSSDVREIEEGLQEQGEEEQIVYTLTVPATWGTPTGTPTVKGYVRENKRWTDVTSTIFPSGAASVTSQVISLPILKNVTNGMGYVVRVKFSTEEGDVKEAYAFLKGRV